MSRAWVPLGMEFSLGFGGRELVLLASLDFLGDHEPITAPPKIPKRIRREPTRAFHQGRRA